MVSADGDRSGGPDLISQDSYVPSALPWETDVVLARDVFNDRMTYIGNIDPVGVLAQGTPELVEEKTRELLKIFAGVPRFVLNAGCPIPAATPSENITAMMRVARSS